MKTWNKALVFALALLLGSAAILACGEGRIEYSYPRNTVVGGGFDIDNAIRGTNLADEIETLFPATDFRIHCNISECHICFAVARDASEQATMATTVTTHRLDL